MAASLITKKRQITIPKEICSHLKIYPNDKVEFLMTDGQVILKSLAIEVYELRSILPKPTKIVSIKQMNKVIANRHNGLRSDKATV